MKPWAGGREEMKTLGIAEAPIRRRTDLEALGALGIGLWLGCGDDSDENGAATEGGADGLTCVAIPAMTEGPFFVDEGLNRANLLGDSQEVAVRGGLPLRLELDVYSVEGSACDESISDQVLASAPYNTRGPRKVLNANDQVFNGTGPGAPPAPGAMGPPPGQTAPGAETMLKLTPLADGPGYRASFRLGLKMA